MTRFRFRAEALPQLWIVVVFALALAERAWIDTGGDVSWLITLGEKMLDGERPYLDFLEVNPPASIYLYVPAVAFARLTGMSPEFAVGLFVFGAAILSLWLGARILTETKVLQGTRLAWLVAIFAAALVVLPAEIFGQREHMALICFLPMLAVSAARAGQKPVALRWAIVAGIGAGLTAIIKPYLVFSVLFTVAAAAVSARSWRPVFAVENWISAALAIFYAAFVVLKYPAFFSDLMPIVTTVYVPEKANLMQFLTLGSMPLWLLALLITFTLKRAAAFSPPFVLMLAASFGFAVSFIIQRKGWAYHSYPMLALALSALVIAYFTHWPIGSKKTETPKERAVRLGCAAAIALIAAATFYWFSLTIDTRGLVAPIRNAVTRPTILSISGDTRVGFPLTRQVGGQWVSRVCSQWISGGAMVAKIEGADARAAAVLDGYIARDRAGLIEDITRNRPEIIVVDRIWYDWLKWAMADPALARLLGNYRELTATDGILVLRRGRD